jgi:hypothetical protein
MAIQVLTNAMVLIGGTDISDHCSKVTIEDTRDNVEVTAMGAVNKAYTKGLGDGKITLDLFQDFAAAKTHALLQPLIGSSTPTTVEVRPTNAARSTTNPACVMQGLLMNYNMLDGAVGAASAITAEFINASQSGLTYPTS